MTVPIDSTRRVLDPTDRVAEILFGLIMVLGFTGSMRVLTPARDDVREMLIGALGCNLAWGLIDAIFYVMGSLGERARRLTQFRALRAASDPRDAHRLISGVLPPVLASGLQASDLEILRLRLSALPEPPARVGLTMDDGLGALGVFLLVFGSTFPVVVPFLVMSDATLASRVSDAIAIVMLAGAGWIYARYTGQRTWVAALAMVVLGVSLVALTVALGG